MNYTVAQRFKSLSVAFVLLSVYLASSFASAQVLQFPRGEFPLTNFKKSSVAIEEILTGGPPRDGIPAIDSPKFVSADVASEWLEDQEPVVALIMEGMARAYPLQILMYHEIVNDEVGGVPVAVTFCPLCNTSIVFERALVQDGKTLVLDFGTTGRLRKSDLVMYDRQSETWWQQFSGKGIIGDLTHVELGRVPSQIISFAQFKMAYPQASVLSQETGFKRPYGNNPYRGYDAIDNNPFLFRGDVDPRLPAMERVLSIRAGGKTQLLPLSGLAKNPVVNLSIDDNPSVVLAATTAASALDAGKISESRQVPAAAAYLATVDGQSLTFELRGEVVVDQQTSSEWNAFGFSTQGELAGTQLQQLDDGVHFAFAWLAFDPDATIINLSD